MEDEIIATAVVGVATRLQTSQGYYEDSPALPATVQNVNAPTPRRRDDVTEYEMDGEAVLLDCRTNALHLLNQTARTVWSYCDGLTPKQYVADVISDTFRIDDAAATEHVTQVIRQLTDIAVLDVEEAP